MVHNDSDEEVRALLPGTGIEVPVTVGAGDAKLVASDLRLGHRRLAYTTAQPMLCVSTGRQDVAVFVGRKGRPPSSPWTARSSRAPTAPTPNPRGPTTRAG